MGKFFEKCSELGSNIFEAVFGVISDIITYIVSLPMVLLSDWFVGQGFSIEMPDMVFEVFDEITYAIGYIFPLNALMPLVQFWLSFYIVKIIISIYNMITKSISIKLTKIS